MADSQGPGSQWPARDIIFMATMTPFMVAACIEWALFIAAFMYCLAKVYQKADHWSIKCLAIAVMILFLVLRGIFLPVMITTLPFPHHISKRFPHAMASFLQWFAFWAFALILSIPWLFCVYRLVTNSIGKTQRIKEALDDKTAPKVVIIMPVYKETPEVLIKAVDSIVDSEYPGCCIHVFLSYDGSFIDEPYLRVINHFGIPISLQNYPQSIDVTYKGARITVSRFKHGGKRHCQKQTFRLIDKVYAEYLKQHDNLFLLFVDSDCMLDRLCLQNFMYDMELKPGSKDNMLAMAGIITSSTKKNTLITVLQDVEYIHGQLFERCVESGCGAVTCLPGALTILRFSAFRKMAKYYFADKAEQCEDLFDYGKCYLGEDRWLTHLFMIGARKRYQIQMCTTAFCKTEAVQKFSSLLKQRRRWFLGYITNEVCMLTDVRLWRRYPLLCLVRLLQNTIRTTALLFFILLVSIITTSSRVEDLPVGFVVISLVLNYTLMLYFGLKLKRYKAWLYPLMFIINPFFNWLYMVYGIFTAGHRTWGGPRTDAARADENTTPAQAVRQAEAQGDELNIQVETFRSGIEGKGVPVHPPRKITGRFSAEEHRPERYDTITDSEAGLTKFLSPLPGIPRIGLHSPWSRESILSSESCSDSIEMPQNVEALVNEERLRLICKAQDTTAPHQSADGSDIQDTANTPSNDRDGTQNQDTEADLTLPREGNRGAGNGPETPDTRETSGSLQSSYYSTVPLTATRSLPVGEDSQQKRLSGSPRTVQSRKRATVA
ncbi:chitin synthase D [Aspergillus lucknowensis]|uniref:chitin synthase n=1 Tax=Aspergillus lucknowensis TaxID=176173 RepID=A0ABR4LLC6_9EURO